MLILVGIAGVGLAAAGTAWETAQRRENERELLFIGKQFSAALRSYQESTPAGSPRFPAKLEDLLRDPRHPTIRRHLRKIYVDPMTRRPVWGLVTAPGGGILAVHSLSQDAPLKVAEFEAQFEAFAGKGRYSDWVFSPATAGAGGTGAKPAAPAASSQSPPVPSAPGKPQSAPRRAP